MTLRGDPVAAVVVRWKGGNEVDHCLASLLAHGGSQLEQVVLVDSGSGDGGAERLARSFPRVTVLALSDNRSFAWAANQGTTATSAPFVLLLNPDTVLPEHSLALLCRFLEERPQAAGAVPLLVGPDGEPQHRWQLRQLPTLPRLAAGLAGAPVTAHVPSQAIPVAQPAAAAWLIRRPVWQALHGFDPSFAPAWWEDVDLCSRLSLALQGVPGFPAREGLWLVPSARIVHHGGSSLAHLPQGRFLEIFYRNLIQYARRHRPRQVKLIRIGVSLSLLGRAALKPRQRRWYIAALRSLTSVD